MKIIKNLWKLKGLVGFTILNAFLTLLIKVIGLLINVSVLYLIGFVLIDICAHLPYPTYLQSIYVLVFFKIMIWVFTYKKSKQEKEII